MERAGFLHAVPPPAGAVDTHDAGGGIVDRSGRSPLPHCGVASSRRSLRHVSLPNLGVVSVLLHNFWAFQGMTAGGMQTQFLKNVGIMGGLLMIAACGAGRWSLDN